MSPTSRDKLHKRTFQLQSAINQISSVRKILCKNSQEIKCQIHSNISRQLEALRNREVWLLNQVDLLQSAKEDALRNQQARLDTALGSVKKTVQLVCDGDYDIDDCDECLDADELKPQETPHLMFQVNSVGLREKIVKYGKIETTGFPDMSIFTGTNDSASLPKAFEDDEDDDQHMLCKTVPRGPNSVSLPGSFRRPRAATVPIKPIMNNSWLARPVKTTVQKPIKTTMDFSDWLKPTMSIVPPSSLRHVSSDASICSWLHQLKTSPHMEDDEFELIDAMMAGGSGNKLSSFSASSCGFLPKNTVPLPTQKPPQTNLVFKAILAQDIALWLRTSPSMQKIALTPPSPSKCDRESPNGTTPQLSDFALYYSMLVDQSDTMWLSRSQTPVCVSSSVMQDTLKTSPATLNFWHGYTSPVQQGLFDPRSSAWIKCCEGEAIGDEHTFKNLRGFHSACVWLREGIQYGGDNPHRNPLQLLNSPKTHQPTLNVGLTASGEGLDTQVSVDDESGECIVGAYESLSVDMMSESSSYYDEWLQSPVRTSNIHAVVSNTVTAQNRFCIKDGEVNLWLLKS